jgi:hypothetical protein
MIGAVQSWRDNASEQAQADLDALLNAVLPFAREQLAAHGKFFPYAAGISLDGELTMRARYAEDRKPRASAVLQWLYDDARAEADSLRAVVFVGDVRNRGKDAMAFQLEHRERISIAIALPYLRSRYHKALSLGTMRASPGIPRVWTASDAS